MENKTVFGNDNTAVAGDAELSSQNVSVVFARDAVMDAEHIQPAIDTALELDKLIQQDQASRIVKQTQRQLLERLSANGAQVFSERITAKLDEVLQEAAIESGLITGTRETLPERIRELADKIEAMGIKTIGNKMHTNSTVHYWPEGIRKSWTPETDDYDMEEWENAEFTKKRREFRRRLSTDLTSDSR